MRLCEWIDPERVGRNGLRAGAVNSNLSALVATARNSASAIVESQLRRLAIVNNAKSAVPNNHKAAGTGIAVAASNSLFDILFLAPLCCLALSTL